MSVRVPSVLIALVVVAAAPASAQPAELQRARSLFEQTAFEDALAVLDAVDEHAGFTREDVIEWLVLRARLASAQGDDALADRELARLARLTDEVALPPDLRERFEVLARSTPELAVTLRWQDGALEAVAIEDPVLVRELRVSARELGAGDARTAVGRLAIAEPTECRADAIGPGGAVLASRAGCPASARATSTGSSDPSDAQDGGDDGVWIALGVTAGVLALAAGAITLGVVLGTPPQDVQVGSVVVRW